MSECQRCKTTISEGLPNPGQSRFKGHITRITWKLRFNYIRMRSWREAPKAADVVESATYSEVELCDSCWGDVLNFICTTKPGAK